MVKTLTNKITRSQQGCGIYGSANAVEQLFLMNFSQAERVFLNRENSICTLICLISLIAASLQLRWGFSRRVL